jgi:hypothetical protein
VQAPTAGRVDAPVTVERERRRQPAFGAHVRPAQVTGERVEEGVAQHRRIDGGWDVGAVPGRRCIDRRIHGRAAAVDRARRPIRAAGDQEWEQSEQREVSSHRATVPDGARREKDARAPRLAYTPATPTPEEEPMLALLILVALNVSAGPGPLMIGYQAWSGDDCKAFIRDNDAYCKSDDCKALIRGNDAYCTTDDCKAVLRKNDAYCKSDDCKAVLRNNDAYCKSDDCKAYIRKNDAYCKTNTCKAVLRNNDAYCD